MITSSNQPATRERIVLAARDLFAERGFAGTTVGALEQAAGLSPRSGALYKHFRSKEQVLRAVFDAQAQDVSQLDSMLGLMPLGDLRAELTLLLRWGLGELSRERQLVRILIKDGDRFPELGAQMRERIVRPAHAATTAWIAGKIEAGELPPVDAAGLAALVIGTVVHYRMNELLFGEPPGGIDEERFVENWIELCLAFEQGTKKKEASR